MIPIVKPQVLEFKSYPFSITLICTQQNEFFWIYKNDIIPQLQKQLNNIEIYDKNFTMILNPYDRYVFIHLFWNILIYNKIDFVSSTKSNFNYVNNTFIFLYFIDVGETIIFPLLHVTENIKTVLCIYGNRPCLKIIVRNTT